VSGTLSLFPEAQWPEVGGQRVPASLTAESGAAYQGDRVLFADATGTPDGHARIARAVACVNALDGTADPAAALAEVRQLLEDLEDADDRHWRQRARAVLALLGGAR